MLEHERQHDTNPYQFGAEERSELTAGLLERQPPVGDSPIVCYRIESNDPAADAARSIEREVFEASFEKNDAKQMKAEYGPYDAASQFFLSVDRTTQQPVGALRVIKNSTDSAKGFKTLDDLSVENARRFPDEYHVDDFSKLWDIGTVAVMDKYRSKTGSVSGQLYAAMYTTAMHEGIEHFVSAIDAPVLKKMRDFLGIPFEPLLDLPVQEYLDSEETQFVYGKAGTFLDSVKKKRRKYIFVKPVREATAPLVGKLNDSFQFPERL